MICIIERFQVRFISTRESKKNESKNNEGEAIAERNLRLAFEHKLKAQSGRVVRGRTVTADVVGFDQIIFYNGLGSLDRGGMMLALKRDVVAGNSSLPLGAGNAHNSSRTSVRAPSVSGERRRLLAGDFHQLAQARFRDVPHSLLVQIR